MAEEIDIPKELLDKYKADIPSKLQELRKLFGKVQQNPNNETITALHYAIHKLRGNSGCYGYYKTSELCKKLEIDLKFSLDNPGNNSAWLKSIKTIYEQIQKDLEKAA